MTNLNAIKFVTRMQKEWRHADSSPHKTILTLPHIPMLEPIVQDQNLQQDEEEGRVTISTRIRLTNIGVSVSPSRSQSSLLSLSFSSFSLFSLCLLCLLSFSYSSNFSTRENLPFEVEVYSFNISFFHTNDKLQYFIRFPNLKNRKID
jgi:hypothetical protein